MAMPQQAPTPKSFEDRAATNRADDRTAVQIIDAALDVLAQNIGAMRGDPSREEVLARNQGRA
jgi:hypothetical protein